MHGASQSACMNVGFVCLYVMYIAQKREKKFVWDALLACCTDFFSSFFLFFFSRSIKIGKEALTLKLGNPEF